MQASGHAEPPLRCPCGGLVFSPLFSKPYSTLTPWRTSIYPGIHLLILKLQRFCLTLWFILNNDPIRQVLFELHLIKKLRHRDPTSFSHSHHEDRLEPDLDPALCDSWAQAPVTAGCFSETNAWAKTEEGGHGGRPLKTHVCQRLTNSKIHSGRKEEKGDQEQRCRISCELMKRILFGSQRAGHVMGLCISIAKRRRWFTESGRQNYNKPKWAFPQDL